MTKKLYLEDQYLREFPATVIQMIQSGERPGIILDQTLFYPTSGGQPHDTGTIKDIPVINVYEDARHGIVHLLAESLAGGQVTGNISWERRFDHMQQHTGQHLLSQAFIKTCNAETISFHMGDHGATLDLNHAGFSVEAMAAVEDLANQIIYENRPVIGHIIEKSELDQYPVRKPPAVEDQIRIVEIKEFDYSPCGGTHCRRTGEIGIVKINRFENYKGGTRVHFLCGRRALKDYQKKSEILKRVGESLSAGESDLYPNIIKIRDELKRLRAEHSHLKKQYLADEAQVLISEHKRIENIHVITKVFEDHHPQELKILARKVLEDLPDTVILFGTKAEGKASLFFSRSEQLACDMGTLMQAACAVIEGRGGGRPQQAQGGGPAVEKLDKAVQCAYDLITPP